MRGSLARRSIWKRLFFIVVIVTAAVCAFYKPGRVLVPEVFGLTCLSDQLCLEDPARAGKAEALRVEALQFVTQNFGPVKNAPRVLFCSTSDCFARFGDPRVRAQNVGTSGIVINARGWDRHIVRHEVIHHWQNEYFGKIHASLILPRWYIEGMAYSLSGDPHDPLPHPDAEQYRREFETWVAQGNDWRIPPGRQTPLIGVKEPDIEHP